MKIQGQTALVAGGASGLGAACVRMLAEAGARVVIADINETAGRAVAAGLNGRASFVRADVADADQMEAAVREAGGLAIAINCAGIAPPRRVLGKDGPAPLAWFETVIRVNLT
ncbi:MAG: SDR family NAD(P)-dependent oxidoreductase, partial [Bryobacteraceae bacterium]